jgi:integrase
MATIKPNELGKLMRDISYASIKLVTRCLLEWQLHTMTRPSESAKAKWSEINLENQLWIIPAERMKMRLEYKVPLTPQTIEILARLKPISSDNRNFDEKSLQFIFTSSKPKNNWSDSESFNKMFVKPHCQASGVRYQGIGQARHTYGSQLVTAGVNLNWIAKQMGHKSIKMLEKHYGRWMESEMPNMAAEVSQKLKGI